MPTESVKIIDPNSGAGFDYTNLNSWTAGEDRDLTASDEIAVAKCRCTGGTADSTTVSMSSTWVTDATRYIKIWTDPSESYRHNGTYQTGNKYRLEVTSSGFLTGSAFTGFIYIIGLQIKVTSTSSWRYGIYLSYTTGSANKVWYEQNIIVGVFSGAADNENGIRLISYNTTHYVSNNVIYGFKTTTANGILTAGPSCLYNNTIVDCTTGFYKSGSWTANVKNCLAQDCTNGFSATWSSGSRNNCSDIVDDAPGSNPVTGDVTFAGSGDYHLAATDTVAKDAGYNLSSDASYAITVDIDNETRTGSWDIGADQNFITNAAATVVGKGLLGAIAAAAVFVHSATVVGKGLLGAIEATVTTAGTAHLGAATVVGKGLLGAIAAAAVFVHSATVVGKGLLGSIVADVTEAVHLGAATVVGKGLLGSIVADVTKAVHLGAATVVGKGLLGAIASSVIFVGTATAVGKGLLGSIVAEIAEAAHLGAATVVGKGLLGAIAANAIFVGSATALGRGLLGYIGGSTLGPVTTEDEIGCHAGI